MDSQNDKPGFWESAFNEKGEMWGFAPANSAVRANDLFLKQGPGKVLVPGIGYGRNARLFVESGMDVTGIEISETAIAMAKKHFGEALKIYHGSVTDMPFDADLYDGIFCHALIHLLDAPERAKLIADCYRQMAPGGHMIFTVISKTAATYGKGRPIGPDRYEQFGGVNLFFYDEDAIVAEFSGAGLLSIAPISENQPFFFIVCRRPLNDITS
ncbi:SAM-dependent methyltransferase [Pedobacter yulinensis]|uniref:SAM-dependent methyltransferase n=1 Tax=Pedobacter yulinensis TaxID=2126353 RepID=A0A2T3HPA2_9SPHI|nr:class I SAM-dependent methyltransferase [Pedobacter yulinensis]PST84272.1 SAM-dependent methyltransferase [Pedobacter yulinensis]